MANADRTSIPAVPVGLLSFLAAAVSYVSFRTLGVWPAKLGGLEVPLLVLLGVGLLLYGRARTR